MREALTLSYWFWPNPGNLHYGDTKALIAIGVGVAFIVLAVLLSAWRKRVSNPVTRTLSRSWATAAAWFGIIAIVLVVSRVEPILFLAMRALWVVWLLTIVTYVLFQIMQFRRRHYTVIETARTADPRDTYLPRKKK